MSEEALPAAGLEPLAGGWSGETFLATAGEARSVVRIYGGRSALRGAAAAEVDAAVLRLVRGLVPVPEVLEARRGRPDDDVPALLVTSFVPGVRGDDVLERLETADRARVGEQVGRLAGTLAGMPLPRRGLFVDADLTVDPFPDADDGLPGWVDRHEPRLLGWTPAEVDGLRDVAAEAQEALDAEDRACLVHADLNPKNWLVDPDSMEVVALLDWEFAHSGHPLTDLGNALRFERDPAWVEAVVGGYAALRGGTTDDLLLGARRADLVALVDLAARAGESPVADRARALLLAIARTGDPQAEPPA